MVDPEKIKQLVELMSEHQLSEIMLRTGEDEIRLTRPGPAAAGLAAHAGDHSGQMQSANTVSGPRMAPPPPVPAEEAGLVPIKSPMVGTFYAGADPQAPPFVTEDASIHENTVVCIIEAMKVFNEIKAGIAGTIVKVLVKNEQPVEYGQPLFLVRPR